MPTPSPEREHTMSTTANVLTIPECDIHKYDMNTPGVPAKYDAATSRGPWANMCEPCWKANRAHEDLGTGKGQEYVLITPEEARSTGPSRADEILPALAAGDMKAAAAAAPEASLEELLKGY